ncbi:acyl-[acyl-carrier-protein]--UDP-N-acetylglucosamine O-acyltransferase [Campylobacterota bacterium]|nr:acyl-[acyl-carrier-protein]--UDP-N-acetylglucosamine O-acyltransferase [Campylobacterota bacterium]
MPTIHPTAIVEDGATLGEGVEVGALAFVGRFVSVGSGTTIAHGAHIEGRTTIGADNRIFPYVVLGTIPQDMKYAGEPTRLLIGDRNTFREFCQVNIGTEHGGGVTTIGSDNLLMGHVHVAHDNTIGDRCIIANFVALAGHVTIGSNVVIGGESAVHQFVKIGDFVMVAGASALSQDLPPFVLAEGNRAAVLGLNLTGLRRHLTRESIDALKPIFKEVFRSNHAPKAAAVRLLNTTLSHEARLFCEFIAESKRGVPKIKAANEEGI